MKQSPDFVMREPRGTSKYAGSVRPLFPGWCWGFWYLLLVWPLLPAGCSRNHYELELTPDGSSMERKLTFWTTERKSAGSEKLAEIREEELRRIETVYEIKVPSPREHKKHVVQTRITSRTPEDIGGAGSYTFWETQMGSLAGYVERFRGQDDLIAQLDELRRGVDKLSDVLIGWFESEIGEHPKFAGLRQFMHVQLRRDLGNVLVYYWTAEAARSIQDGEVGDDCDYRGRREIALNVRIGQYLVERGYFSPESLPSVLRIASSDSEEELLGLGRELVASKMGLKSRAEIDEALAFLATPERTEKSLEEYLRGTREYRAALERWEQEKTSDPDLPEPEPSHVLADEVRALIHFTLFPSYDELTVKLACPNQPFRTNGRWNAETNQVLWSTRIDCGPDERYRVLPAMPFAMWSVADADFQTEHFGKVILQQQELAEYVIWRKALTSQEGDEWDRFVSTLRPGEDLLEQVNRFRFSTDPQRVPGEDCPPKSLADTPRRLITKALKPSERSARESPTRGKIAAALFDALLDDGSRESTVNDRENGRCSRYGPRRPTAGTTTHSQARSLFPRTYRSSESTSESPQPVEVGAGSGCSAGEARREEGPLAAIAVESGRN